MKKNEALRSVRPMDQHRGKQLIAVKLLVFKLLADYLFEYTISQPTDRYKRTTQNNLFISPSNTHLTTMCIGEDTTYQQAKQTRLTICIWYKALSYIHMYTILHVYVHVYVHVYTHIHAHVICVYLHTSYAHVNMRLGDKTKRTCY